MEKWSDHYGMESKMKKQRRSRLPLAKQLAFILSSPSPKSSCSYFDLLLCSSECCCNGILAKFVGSEDLIPHNGWLPHIELCKAQFSNGFCCLWSPPAVAMGSGIWSVAPSNSIMAPSSSRSFLQPPVASFTSQEVHERASTPQLRFPMTKKCNQGVRK